MTASSWSVTPCKNVFRLDTGAVTGTRRRLLSGLLGILLACATQGRHFNADAVALIQPGATTEARLLELFGRPTGIRQHGTGGSEWRYDFRETRRASTSLFTKIGRALGAIFGYRTVLPPVDLEYSNTTRHQLNVKLDAAGTVIDYTYDVKEVPRTRVY